MINQDWLNPVRKNFSNGVKEIQNRVKKVPISSGRSNKLGRISWDDLVFVPAQLVKKPVDYFRKEIISKTIIGKKSRKPIEIATPIIFGAMSFGALSREAKTALAKASALAGTVENTGEGGMLPEERKFSRNLIVQYSTGRFGITEEILKKADAIEIKIGQGAKPGCGGYLPGEKVTDEIAKVRNVEKGRDVYSPACHFDIKNIDDLRKKIDWLKKISDGVPIIIKLAAGNVENDIKLAIKTNPDIIAVDGMEGGTGAAAEVMLDEVGIPTIPALVRARKVLDKLNASQELWIGGGLIKGGDFAKAIALGADAIFIGSPLLVAMGCLYCRQCWTGKCPKGIATQDAELRKNLNIEKAAQDIASYVKNCTEEIKIITGAVGKNNINDLSKDDLRALNLEISKITELKLVSER
jgi:glutamate synthase domain-containing protein 2